jgi:hypothetical protein
MANTYATVKRSDAFGKYVQLRVSATETSEFIHGGVVFNGKPVQVVFSQGSFCKVRVQSDSETLVGFVKKEHLVFETGVERGEGRSGGKGGEGGVRDVRGGGVARRGGGGGEGAPEEIEGFVETQCSEIEMSSKAAREKFQAIRETGSIEDRWKYLKAYIEAKQREVSDYHLQNVRPMEELMSMKAIESIKERALE